MGSPEPDLAAVGERGLIERIRARAVGAVAPSSVVVGIGDDCAVVRPPGDGFDLLLEVDEAIEGVHFRLDWMAGADVGHRLAVQGLSDVAAMGGAPLWALLTLAAPRTAPASMLEAMAAGLAGALASHGVPLVGGDVAESPGGVHLTVTVVGSVPRGRAVLRSGACPGQALFVTGDPGLARAGWRLLERGLGDRAGAARAVARFRRPEPRLHAAAVLVERFAPSAMIDLSDGLLGDAGQLARASGCAVEIDPAALPVGDALAAAAALLGEDPRALALAGGDDFELLFALDGGVSASELEAALGLPVARCGSVRAGDRGVSVTGATAGDSASYEHFR